MLNLTSEPPKNALPLPESNSDIVREAAEVLTLDGPLNIPPKAITTLRVKTGHFTLNASINTVRKANRLVVTFMGARPGGTNAVNSRRPMFARRHWDALFRSPILAISDPQTEVDWQTSGQRTGFYIGTFEHDLVPEILALVDKVCDELGIGRDKVVMYGASAGGTAALLVGSRRRQQTGIIAACPWLRPDKYREQVVEIAARLAGGDLAAWEKMNEETPWRANPLTALRDGLNEGNDTRVVIAQNLKDKMTINRHFPGIWRRFDIPPEGGVSANGRVMAMMYDSEEAGHGHEPAALSLPLVRAAYEFFGNPIEEAPKKEKKFSKAKLAARAALAAQKQGQAGPEEEDDEDDDEEEDE
jgi:hypothetical protein